MKKILIICLLFICVAPTANAARLYFEPEESIVGTTTPFRVALLADSEEPVNAFSIKVTLPPNMSVVEFSDADSVINYWLDPPVYDESDHTLHFSGVIPGGYKGIGGRLGIMHLQASQTGVSAIGFDAIETFAYKNTPNADKAELALSSLNIRVVSGKDNLDTRVPDDIPPETFAPEIARLPDEYGLWNIVFQAQDKESGIDFYEVSESKKKIRKYGSLTWRKGESPVLLNDQTLSSYIYVRAVDKIGNERVMIVEPINAKPWFVRNMQYIIILFIFTLSAFILRKNAKQTN